MPRVSLYTNGGDGLVVTCMLHNMHSLPVSACFQWCSCRRDASYELQTRGVQMMVQWQHRKLMHLHCSRT